MSKRDDDDSYVIEDNIGSSSEKVEVQIDQENEQIDQEIQQIDQEIEQIDQEIEQIDQDEEQLNLEDGTQIDQDEEQIVHDDEQIEEEEYRPLFRIINDYSTRIIHTRYPERAQPMRFRYWGNSR